MNKKLFFLLGLAVLVTTAIAGDPQYDFQAEFDKSVDEAETLCAGSAENNGDCVLYQSFQNISTQLSATWVAADVTAYNAFLAEVQITLASTTYTDIEKYILVSGLVDQFAVEYSTCYETFAYFNLTTTTNVNVMSKVVIVKQQTTIQSTITLDSSDNAPLFDALLAAAQETGDAACISDVQALIETELIAICSSSIELKEKIKQIEAKIKVLYATYPDFEVKLKKTKIQGFGFFSQYIESSITYTQQTQMEVLVTGTYPDIPLITYLEDAAAVYYAAGKYSEWLKLKQFISRVNSTFQLTVSWEERQVLFANIVQEWLGANYSFTTKVIFSIEFGSFGSVWDFCFVTGFKDPIEVTFPTEGTTLLSSTPVCSCICEDVEGEDDF